MKNPLTLAGIELTTIRFVVQHLNHCATAVPSLDMLARQLASLQIIIGISQL